MSTDELAKPLLARRTGPLKGTVRPPGDKSISHRALMLGALAIGETAVDGLLEGEDVLATAEAMRRLGATVTRTGPGAWRINGLGVGGLLEPASVIDYGNAGTGVRLALGVAGGHAFSTTFTGDASLVGRPMGRVLDPLRRMGIQAIARSGERLPLTIHGPDTLVPIEYRLPVPSAQVKSAILLAALNSSGVTTVIEPIATRDHTERMLTAFGASIEVEAGEDNIRTIRIEGRHDLKPQAITVPGDPSSSAFPIVAALIVDDSDVTVENMLLNPGRIGLLDTLREMGGDITISGHEKVGGEEVGSVHVKASRLTGVTVPAARAPSMIDEYPILAMAAALADGDTVMEGVGEMRVKETDRIAAVVAGLKANGVEAEDAADSLSVRGAASIPGGGTVTTNLDHRIAMSFLVLGLAADNPVTIDDARPITTSFPGFRDLMTGLGADLVDTASA